MYGEEVFVEQPMETPVRLATFPQWTAVTSMLDQGADDMAYTEIISFPYTPSDRDPPSSKFGLNYPRIAGIRITVRFRTGQWSATDHPGRPAFLNPSIKPSRFL